MNFSSVNDVGLFVGAFTLNVNFALAPLGDNGVYPKCFAIDIVDAFFTAESKNISLTTMFARYAL